MVSFGQDEMTILHKGKIIIVRGVCVKKFVDTKKIISLIKREINVLDVVMSPVFGCQDIVTILLCP